MIRVLIADDQALVRAGFAAILDDQHDIEVVGEAADGVEAVEMAHRLRPNVVLMDIRMPRVDGLEATKRLLSDRRQSLRVMILTTFDLDQYVYEALKAGASGFLLKDAPRDELVAGVRTVAAGEALLSSRITKRLIEEFVRRPLPGPDIAPELKRLSAREREVFELMGRGLSNPEIAEALFIGDATVKTHVGRIMAKLSLRDRVQAVVLAYESGIVQPGAGKT